MTRNKAIDYIRSRKTRNDFNIQMATSNVNKTVELRPEHMDVEDHLDKLEPKYKQVLHALFYMGMTQQEVSDNYQLPLGTVKTRLKIGLRELRKTFNCGVGMIVCVEASNVDKALELLNQNGETAWEIGEIQERGSKLALHYSDEAKS